MSSSSSRNIDQKRRITKTEKIAELQGKLKIITEENRRLKGKPSSASTTNDSDTRSDDGCDKSVGMSKSHGERDKLKEALRTLKRVTVKQEVSLATLMQRARQRRSEIDQKDIIIEKLQQENKAFRIAHEKMKENGSDDVSVLLSQFSDLELQLAKEESSKAEQPENLEREAGISSLQTKLANVIERGVRRNHSSDSHGALSMASDVSASTSGEDVARLKKELAKKSEKLTNLQHELEAYKDEVHDLKQKNQFSNAFPTTPAQSDDDFFDDNNTDDDFWGNFE